MSLRAANCSNFESSDAFGARLLDVLRAALTAGARLVAITVPAPALAPDRAFGIEELAPSYYLARGDQEGEVGLGVAVKLDAATLDDAAELERRADDLLHHCFEAGLDAAARPPKFFGGFGFVAPRDPSSPWSAFARVTFLLPRHRYRTDGSRGELTLFVLAEELADARAQHHYCELTCTVLLALEAARREAAQVTPVLLSRVDTPDRESWTSLVNRARDRMRASSLDKVVLARQITLNFATPLAASFILSRLTVLAPETTRFALCAGGSTFLGATPERLVRRIGSEIRTEALAGSIRAADPLAADLLLASQKERHEHQLVVSDIVGKLQRIGAKSEPTPSPQIRQLRHVLHLSTPITARLFGPPHVLTLAANLHPTPAVGGVPESEAVQFIEENEGFDRGFYSGTIGWFDASGDGEFLVALRSGLLRGGEFRLFAGAGIVPDSDPDQEFDETELKFESLLEALKIPPPSSTTPPREVLPVS